MIDQEFRNPRADPGRARRRTRGASGADDRRRVPLREDRIPAAQPRAEPAASRRRAPTPRSGRRSPTRAPGDSAGLGAGARVDRRVGVPRLHPDQQAAQAVGRAERQLRAQQVGVGRRQRARLRRLRRGQHLRPVARVECRRASTAGISSTATRWSSCPYDIDASSGFRFLSGLPIDATMGRDANGIAAVRIVPTARRACRSSATGSATSRSRKSTCALQLGRQRRRRRASWS